MKSKLPVILGAIALLAIGVLLGRSVFSAPQEADIPIPSTIKYRNTGSTSDTTQIDRTQEFKGQIIEVKDGESIQSAVEAANPGDLIRVFPGTYSENVYIDKDDISLQGVVIKGKWPTLDGKKEINDAFLY